MQAISDAAERAAALTAQLLAFSRQQVVTMKVLDINAGGHDDRADAQPAHRRERWLWLLKLDPEAGHVRADAGQIDQIIVNLVVNARDAMPERRDGHDRDGNVSFDERYTIEHFDGEARAVRLSWR